MIKRQTVRLEGPKESVSRHRRALATLTEHFEVVEGPADLALAAGDFGATGSRVVLASDPIQSFEATLPVHVIPVLRFAPHLFAQRLRERVLSPDYTLVDSLIKIDRSLGDTAQSALLEQLAALRAVTGRAARVTSLKRIGDGYLAQGECEGVGVLTFSGVSSQATGPEFTLNAAKEEVRLDIEIDNGATARPPRIRLFDAQGASCPPTVHQSGDRLTWLAAFAAAVGERPNGYHGEEWQADLKEVEKAFSRA